MRGQQIDTQQIEEGQLVFVGRQVQALDHGLHVLAENLRQRPIRALLVHRQFRNERGLQRREVRHYQGGIARIESGSLVGIHGRFPSYR